MFCHLTYRECLESPHSRPCWCHDPGCRRHKSAWIILRSIPSIPLPLLGPGGNIGEPPKSGNKSGNKSSQSCGNQEQWQCPGRAGGGSVQAVPAGPPGPARGRGGAVVHLHRVRGELCPPRAPAAAPARPQPARAQGKGTFQSLLTAQPHLPSLPGPDTCSQCQKPCSAPRWALSGIEWSWGIRQFSRIESSSG